MGVSPRDCCPRDIHRKWQRAHPRTSFGTKPQSNVLKIGDFFIGRHTFLARHDLILQARFPLKNNNLLFGRWKVYLVTSKGPGRRSSCQRLMKTLHLPPSLKENRSILAKKHFIFAQDHELLASLFPSKLLSDDLWKPNGPVELYLWFHE